MRRSKHILGIGLALAVGAISAQAVSVKTIVVVDESGSMGGEHAWLPGVISSLDTKLTGLGFTTGYGLVGFGASSGHGISGHKHLVGGSDFGSAAAFGTAAGTLVTSGGFEDGYEAIEYALDNYALAGEDAINIILVTDENRDRTSGSPTDAAYFPILSGKLAAAGRNGAILNAVVDNPFTGGGSPALGVDGDGAGDFAYVADGSGGFTKVGSPAVGNGDGATETTYVPLAFASSGAAWDLNKLRAGGLTGESFTKAFIDIKVREITGQLPDAGSTVALFGLAIACMAGVRRRRNA